MGKCAEGRTGRCTFRVMSKMACGKGEIEQSFTRTDEQLNYRQTKKLRQTNGKMERLKDGKTKQQTYKQNNRERFDLYFI